MLNRRYGDKFIGDWLDAKKHGDGELLYVNGDRFKVRAASVKCRGAETCLLRHNISPNDDTVKSPIQQI